MSLYLCLFLCQINILYTIDENDEDKDMHMNERPALIYV